MTAHFPGDGLDHGEVTSVIELPIEIAWSKEQECVPLKQRLKMLRSTVVSESRQEILISAGSQIGVVVEKEDLCSSSGYGSDQDGSDADGHNQHGIVHGTESPPLQDRLMLERREIEYIDDQDNFKTQLPNCEGPCADQIVISEHFFEDLDHVVLKDRQRMLQSRYPVGSTGPAFEDKVSALCPDLVQRTVQKAGIGSDNCGIRSVMGERGSNNVKLHDGNADTPCEVMDPCLLNDARPCFSSRHDISETCLSSLSCSSVCTLALPSSRDIKVEPLDDKLKITNKDAQIIKVEPLDDESQVPNKDALDIPCIGSNQISVKSELVDSAESLEDIIDHMMLGDRMRLLASHTFPKTILNESCEASRTRVPSVNDLKPTSSEPSAPLLIKRPRKRRKTVTDSVETALEEDAPGLLQVLIERGILVDEIKLYGETEDDESLDQSSILESFSEFEDVITKIFSERHSLLKVTPIRCGKGERVSYCLGCLISLVEQARYLRLRKWPVEWGWCRDLQSFIFVFERHNRIVVERPEYGYATYFFELVDALPVHWQIRRLVTAMKLTSCSRMTLIENRALMVGDDLTEGEARVLMEYGWIRGSGLGTMLNYRDRVVHDRKNDENERSEWRSKIGKLLTDGYNGGTIVPTDIPKRVMEIKLEQ